MPRNSYCGISDYLEKNYEILYKLFRENCLMKSLSPNPGNYGVTLLIPSDAQMKNIESKLRSHENTYQIAESLIIEYYLDKASDFTKEFEDSGKYAKMQLMNRAGFLLKPEVSGKGVTLAGGAQLEKEDFNIGRAQRAAPELTKMDLPIAIWRIKNDKMPPVSGETGNYILPFKTKLNMKTAKRERKTGAREHGGSVETNLDRNNLLMLTLLGKNTIDYSDMACYVSSFLKFVENNHRDKFNGYLALFDKEPACAFFIYFEPYVDSPRIVNDQMWSDWTAYRNTNKLEYNPDLFKDYCNKYDQYIAGKQSEMAALEDAILTARKSKEGSPSTLRNNILAAYDKLLNVLSDARDLIGSNKPAEFKFHQDLAIRYTCHASLHKDGNYWRLVLEFGKCLNFNEETACCGTLCSNASKIYGENNSFVKSINQDLLRSFVDSAAFCYIGRDHNVSGQGEFDSDSDDEWGDSKMGCCCGSYDIIGSSESRLAQL